MTYVAPTSCSESHSISGLSAKNATPIPRALDQQKSSRP